MKKRFLLIPAVGLPLLAAIPAISSYANATNNKIAQNKIDIVAQPSENFVDSYSVTEPALAHYTIGEKLDLRDLKVTYNDPGKGAIDVTNECKINMQNDQELTQEGELDVTIQHNEFSSSFKIYVEKEAHEISNNDPYTKMGDIDVEFKLMSNQECILTGYEDGEGTLEIPDFVEHDGVKYFIKQIPSDWSDGENDITGLKFNENVSHLKKICDHAFDGTNCLDYYIEHKSELLEFPEGLEEIGKNAFSGTDYGQHSIKGYSFPSTLKKICEFAFSFSAPYIDGDDDNGELWFKSVPDIDALAFRAVGIPVHDCKWIYGDSIEIIIKVRDILRLSNCFNNSSDFLIPRLINTECKLEQFAWGNITVECVLLGDECRLIKYISGSGQLTIPDYVENNGGIYYVKEIPSDWSDGENDITDVKFNCQHLKKICDSAFENTNCLDGYINNKNQLLEFPEGLEEIGEYAFFGTDWGQNTIRGYSFPSTLKKIGNKAFSKAPYIDGDDNNGELQFRSVPEIAPGAFCVYGTPIHNCKYIYGKTIEIADAVIRELSNSHNFNTKPDYLVPSIINGSFESSQFTWGDIIVECKLTADECFLFKYVSGSGQLTIPDYVEHNEKKYYVKEIPSDWSDGENDITGLKFECTHLKKICDNAFKNTNCLDYYIKHKKELLEFPEGLEEIGISAFDGTDYGQHSIKGYSFPSTMNKICESAFANSPYIDGDDNNGELWFKSVPTLYNETFYINGKTQHKCKYIYGSTLEIAREMHNKILTFGNYISALQARNFDSGKEFLIPRLIGDDCYETIKFEFGDITVECGLTGDECQLIDYDKGTGTLIIPDNIVHNNKTFYIKEIPYDWSDGENDITGLKFECKHLKKIRSHAFEGTNCLDYYMKNKNELLIFPEGLEEIGSYAFSGTDYGTNKIKGYSFPSTLKKIEKCAFGNYVPCIDGNVSNGGFHFQSVPEIAKDAFLCDRQHIDEYVYAPTQEMIDQIVKLID